MNHTQYTLQALNLEIERTLYGKIDNFAVLNKARSATRIEQWEMRSDDAPKGQGGVVRVRSYDRKRFEMCMKRFVITNKGAAACLEEQFEITKSAFEQFRELAPLGFIKTRYVFEVPGQKNVWEVDVFENQKGGKCAWCKLDYEASSSTAPLPELPFEFSVIFEHAPSKAGTGVTNTEKIEKMVDHLYANEFTVVNPTSIGQIKLEEKVEPVDFEKDDTEDKPTSTKEDAPPKEEGSEDKDKPEEGAASEVSGDVAPLEEPPA